MDERLLAMWLWFPSHLRQDLRATIQLPIADCPFLQTVRPSKDS